MPHRRPLPLLAVALALPFVVAAAGAQPGAQPGADLAARSQRATVYVRPANTLVSERTPFYLAVNVVVGMTHAGIGAWRGRRPILPALGWGAAGGVTSFAGIRLTGQGGAARLPGVLLSATGASIARNAAAGAPPLGDVLLPLAPFHLRIRPGANDPLSMRLSASGGVAALHILLASGRRARVHWRETLQSGGLTFRSASGRISRSGVPGDVRCPGEEDPALEAELAKQGITCTGAAAVHINGVIVLGSAPRYREPTLGAHETVHRAQFARDAAMHAPLAHRALGAPLRRGPLARLGRLIDRTIVLDPLLPLSLANLLVGVANGERNDCFYEREAEHFTGSTLCGNRPFAKCAW